MPALKVGTPVEIMSRARSWVGGFVVDAVTADGYSVRHEADAVAVPVIFESARVRPESTATTTLVAHVILGNMGTVCSALNGLREDWHRLPEKDRLSLLGIAERQALHVYNVLGDVVRGLPSFALDRALGDPGDGQAE